MNNFSKLDSLLKSQATPIDNAHTEAEVCADVYGYARSMAFIENVIAVVSDLKHNTSRIFGGEFANMLGLANYKQENSIWEKKILSMMSVQQQEEKLVTELRFFHYLRRLGKNRGNHYLMSKLRFRDGKGG